jgi:glycosyltransferase involved in cell wall biosynthesis
VSRTLVLRRPGISLRIGWATAGTLDAASTSFSSLESAVAMRIADTARWIDANAPDVANEMYRRGRPYDVVVFFKDATDAVLEEAVGLQERGVRVVFDANVNYYEVWGEYEVPGTRPTPDQQRGATALTRLADWVVADSSYLLTVIRRLTERASWIPDNVDLRLFRTPRRHRRRRVTTLVWSGIAKKALPLLDITDALGSLRGAEFVVVSNEVPAELRELRAAIPCRFVRYGPRRYVRLLRRCDLIVSPKRLVNGYELGHTEWKITLGMAAGLPAVASPQQSYVEAIGHAGGGIVADSREDWRGALERLVEDPGLRGELGSRARRTVSERYATPVVARQYLELLRSLG